MTVPSMDPRPASPPLTGLMRTGLGASVLATALIGGLGIANPVLAAAAVAAGTSVLSMTGKISRDYLAQPEGGRGKLAGVRALVASLFAWLG